MLTDVSMESTDATPSMAEPRLPLRLDYWSNESEINDLELNNEEVKLEVLSIHDEDELTSAVRLSSPFCPTG